MRLFKKIRSVFENVNTRHALCVALGICLTNFKAIYTFKMQVLFPVTYQSKIKEYREINYAKELKFLDIQYSKL